MEYNERVKMLAWKGLAFFNWIWLVIIYIIFNNKTTNKTPLYEKAKEKN
jgi:hypothetical protein